MLAQMPREHGCKVWIAFRRQKCCGMTKRPKDESGDPLLEPKPERCRDRPVDDRDDPRDTAEQDRFDKGAVDRRFEPNDMLVAG